MTQNDSQYLEPESPVAVDNPEYFQSMSPDNDVAIEGLKSKKDAPRLRSPDSSDTDYYNECDRHEKNKHISLNNGLSESVI